MRAGFTPILALSFTLALAGAALLACGDDEGDGETDAGSVADVAADTVEDSGFGTGADDGADPSAAGDQSAADASAEPPFSYEVPLAPDSPWPKFRRDARQSGRSPVRAGDGEGALWRFQTGKGIFSTPVIDADGTVYVGSADRFFYALDKAGALLWKVETGEIIDSSALLDDKGRVYFGSGDGVLRALEAEDGEAFWRFEADDPSVNKAFIRWFEGNVAMGADGTLYVPNDNYFVYAIDRDDGEVLWRFKVAEQTWSLPAVDVRTGNICFGNNNLLPELDDNTFCVSESGGEVWAASVNGTIAASPLIGEDLLFLGGFDGFLRAYELDGGKESWSFGTRDHIYASPAELSDGTIVQPSADGTVYALDPEKGTVMWAFDTLEPIRSSPAVDGDDRIYFGSGEGRLFVLNGDGTLRWALRLIAGDRNDLNASPALGHDSVVVAGESGEIFSVPLDYCLTEAGEADDRCRPGPGEDLPEDGVHVRLLSNFGTPLAEPPAAIHLHQPLAFALLVRKAGDTELALIDADSLEVTVEPDVEIKLEVSADRRFFTVAPATAFSLPAGGGDLQIVVKGKYLVEPERDGLVFKGGEEGGTFDETFGFGSAESVTGPLPLNAPGAPGEPGGAFELHRLAAPLPTILPSYNQIGFDSLHYVVGLVDTEEDNEGVTTGVAWVAGASPREGSGLVAIDPETKALFPVELRHGEGRLTLVSEGGFRLEVMNANLAFDSFRVGAAISSDGTSSAPAVVHVTASCGDIPLFGSFLRRLGFCNPQTDVLNAYGAVLVRPFDAGESAGPGILQAPSGVGTVAFTLEDDALVATLSETELKAGAHRYAALAISADDGSPLLLDYGPATTVTADDHGLLQQVRVSVDKAKLPEKMRVCLMVDAYPAAKGEVEK